MKSAPLSNVTWAKGELPALGGPTVRHRVQRCAADHETGDCLRWLMDGYDLATPADETGRARHDHSQVTIGV
jgi:hypothetical protein